MPQLTVLRFGQEESLEVPDVGALTFPDGIVGMPHLHEFVVVEDERVAPCRWLQSLEEPALAFLVVEPELIEPEYRVELAEEDATALELGDRDDASVWVLITIKSGAEHSTANLLAPVVVNPRTRVGRQVILHESGYSLRHPLTPSPAATGEGDAPSSAGGAASSTLRGKAEDAGPAA